MSTHSFRTDYSTVAATPITDYKTYPLHLLFTSNYKLPPDVDRCNLEKHLADADFEMAFNMNRDEFYSLPLWRRNDLKRRVRLFWAIFFMARSIPPNSNDSQISGSIINYCLMENFTDECLWKNFVVRASWTKSDSRSHDQFVSMTFKILVKIYLSLYI